MRWRRSLAGRLEKLARYMVLQPEDRPVDGRTDLPCALWHQVLVAGIDPVSPSASSDNEGSEALTVRERELLLLICAGYSNKEIADLLSLAEGTVKNHVSNLLQKLDARDRTRAALKALQQGHLD